jgi:hypothetical protein
MSQRSISRNEIIANDPRYYRMQGQIATLRVPGSGSYDPECGWQMKRVLVASVAPMLLLAQFSDGFAAGGSGPFDGNWTGSATSTVEQCKSAKVTVTVEGMIVTGQAQFANDAPNINRTVREDGTFGTTIGWQPLTGKFSADEFEGMFKNGDCEWKMLLQRTRNR